MDPVQKLPVEIIEHIWNMLPLSDLLACRAVSRTWRATSSACCKVWRQHCSGYQLADCHCWYELFLNESKMKWPWMMASFSHELIINNILLFDCTDDYIYVVDGNHRLIKYDNSGSLIAMTALQRPCSHLFVLANDVMLVGPSRRSKPVMTMMPLRDGWCLKAHDRVYIQDDDSSKILYSSPVTPMSNVFLTMITDTKQIVAIIDEKVERAGKHTDSTVLVFRDGVKLHRADVHTRLLYWCFSGQYLVLASHTDLISIHLVTGELAASLQVDGTFQMERSVKIHGLQDILNQPRTSLVLLDCLCSFCVFDVEKRSILATIDCPSRRFIHTYPSIVCKPTMFVYSSENDTITVRRPILKIFFVKVMSNRSRSASRKNSRCPPSCQPPHTCDTPCPAAAVQEQEFIGDVIRRCIPVDCIPRCPTCQEHPDTGHTCQKNVDQEKSVGPNLEATCQNMMDAVDREMCAVNYKIRNIIEELRRLKEDVCRLSKQDGSCSGGQMTDAMKKATLALIKEELLVYDSDKTGMPDYAMSNLGGCILSTRDTRTFKQRASKLSILGLPIMSFESDPKIVIQAGTLPGECWAFEGCRGTVVIQLSCAIIVTHVTLEHISERISPSGEISSAPKQFQVKGLNHINDPGPHCYGEFTYSIEGPPLQTFEVQRISMKEFRTIEFAVLSNHGNPDFTCIYRIRIHGRPQ